MMKLNSIYKAGKLLLLSGTIALGFTNCGSDLFVDPAGTCVTCTYAATASAPARVLEACADGDGNITVEEAGEAPITSENTLTTFRLPHEASGATCQ